jgi:hypothetical protein
MKAKKAIKISLVLLFVSVLTSCTPAVKEVEVDREAGEYVASGTKYTIGSDEKAEIVKKVLISYAAMDAESVFSHFRDSIIFSSYNSKEETKMNVEMLKEEFSNYDSIISSPVYFLPYKQAGSNREFVNVTTLETKYKKNGEVEVDRFLAMFLFGDDDKIYKIRQFRTEWQK